jgi:hypothetical protein
MTGVLTSPTEAFADIAQKPRWLPPLALATLLGLLFVYLFTVRVGWDRAVQALASHPSMERAPAERRADVMAQQRKFMPYGVWGGASVGPIVMAAVTAAVLLGVFNLGFGAQFKFKGVFAAVSYSYMTTVVSTAAAVLVLFLKDPDEYRIDQPTAFNLGAFLSPDSTPAWLRSLGGSIDLFMIWTLVLLAFGIRALDPKRSLGSCLTGVLVPWGLLVLIKMGWAAIFG